MASQLAHILVEAGRYRPDQVGLAPKGGQVHNNSTQVRNTRNVRNIPRDFDDDDDWPEPVRNFDPTDMLVEPEPEEYIRNSVLARQEEPPCKDCPDESEDLLVEPPAEAYITNNVFALAKRNAHAQSHKAVADDSDMID